MNANANVNTTGPQMSSRGHIEIALRAAQTAQTLLHLLDAKTPEFARMTVAVAKEQLREIERAVDRCGT